MSSIGSYAFNNCTSLSGINLPNSLKSIGTRTFAYDSALKTASIGGSSLSIGNNAFRECSGLKTMTFKSGCSLALIDDAAFAECSQLSSNMVFPAQLTSIGNEAFYECTSITAVDATACTDLANIGEFAFKNCSRLYRFWMAENNQLKEIKTGTYQNCEKLGAFSGAVQVSAIGDYAFYGTRSIVGWTAPAAVRSIGSYAFAYSGVGHYNFNPGIQTIGQ